MLYCLLNKTFLNEDKIIVFRKFQSSIDANIAKTKLDAYGIPCYLTEENMTMLTTAFLSGGVRLHVFQQDQERVEQLLHGDLQNMTDDDGILICPKCNSKKIISLNKSNLHQEVNQALLGFIMGLKSKFYCQDCGNEFD